MFAKTSLICAALFCALSLNAQTTQGTYFSDTFDTLKRELNLANGQLSKIKPLLEQETGELEEIACNPVTSHASKIKAIERIVRGSNENIKQILTASQYEKLLQVREAQMRQARNSDFSGTNPPNLCSSSRRK